MLAGLLLFGNTFGRTVTMSQQSLRAVFMRGGTSKAVVFRQEDLPADRSAWPSVFLSVMGSPDPYGRQLDGMGGGISSLSKVCVVGPPSRPDADIDYTFAQVSVDSPVVDLAGNCGNMSSAMGPFAIDEGLVVPTSEHEAVVRINNTNTDRVIVARFPLVDGRAAVSGDEQVDGVAGTGAKVRLDFLEPAGGKTGSLLPTGHPVDELTLSDGKPVPASMVDLANPCVFVPAAALGLDGTESPDMIDSMADVMDRLEQVRRLASVAMGLTEDLAAAAALQSIPKVAIVAAAQAYTTLSGRPVAAAEVDLLVRMISMGRAHRAVPVTGALCLAGISRVAGSLPASLLTRADGDIRVGHPSGVLSVDAASETLDGAPHIRSATVYRTARRLFEGRVLYRG
jgi:2-methylaconitate cis-trans-isomerase PrpF